MFREPCSPLHQGEKQSEKQLSSSGPFLSYYATYWSGGGKEENCGMGEVEEIGRSSITRENGFLYFIYVVTIISI